MEIILILIALCCAYGLGRKHGGAAVKRKAHGFLDWLK